MTFFISGHRDITQEEFDKYYKPAIDNVLINYKPAVFFVVGDYRGVDTMAQQYLYDKTKELFWFDSNQVTVYHMFDSPRNFVCNDFKTKGGFKTDEERDAAMTKDSDTDIAFVRKGKRNSGTAQNIVRRYEF